MKLNIAMPATGAQKTILVDDEKKLRAFFDKRIAQEVGGESLGPEFAGYVFRISGGNDKQGFPMMQGVLSQSRVRLLMKNGAKCYRSRRAGERKRKSVRGCIVGPDLAVLNLVIVKAGATAFEGVSDVSIPKRLGPKRANNIRALFGLEKGDDVRQYLAKRTFTTKAGKTQTKSPKIQRLVTPLKLQRKRRLASQKKAQVVKVKREEAEYSKLYQQRMKEAKERRASEISKRKSLRKSKDSAK